MGHKINRLDPDSLRGRIRSVERYVWVRLPDAKVETSLMGKRVVFCAWTSEWKVRASIDRKVIEREDIDPIELASAIVLEMKTAISLE